MTDIVERLRAHPGPDDSVTVQFRTMNAQRGEAADEIERLKARVAELEQRPTDEEIKEATRRALERKP